MTTTTLDLRDTGRATLTRIGAALNGFTAFLRAIPAAHSCTLEVERLMALSDDQLGSRGLERDAIMRYALRKHMGV